MNQGILLVTILRQSVTLSQWMIMEVKWLDFQNNHFFLPSIDRVMHVVFCGRYRGNGIAFAPRTMYFSVNFILLMPFIHPHSSNINVS